MYEMEFSEYTETLQIQKSCFSLQKSLMEGT